MSRYEDTSNGMTQHEVAKELGISIARVGQLENSALRKLRSRPASLLVLSELSRLLDANRRDSNPVLKR